MKSLLELEPGSRSSAKPRTARNASACARRSQPDVAILDIAMPRLNGIEVAARALKQSPQLKVIILSMYADESYVVRALERGGAGVPAEGSNGGRSPARGESSRRGTLVLQPGGHAPAARGLRPAAQAAGPRRLLSPPHRPREGGPAAPGRGPVQQGGGVGARSWAVSTVETHRANLMQKLSLRNTAEIVLYAVRKGVIA